MPTDEPTDFAQEHESPGFHASLPIAPGAFEADGPLDGLDPDYRAWGAGNPHRWERFKYSVRRAWRRATHH